MLDLTKEYLCPYCADKSLLNKFLIMNKKGEYNKKMAKCPLCNERMRLKTLIANMTPYEWGLWLYLNIRVYNSPKFKFYDKWQHDIFFINFDLLPKYIKNEWWKGFKEYKGYTDRIELESQLHILNIKFGIESDKKQKVDLNMFNYRGCFVEV